MLPVFGRDVSRAAQEELHTLQVAAIGSHHQGSLQEGGGGGGTRKSQSHSQGAYTGNETGDSLHGTEARDSLGMRLV